jgi:hypothetical protein
VDTGFQHFAHGDRHELTFQRLSLKSSPDHLCIERTADGPGASGNTRLGWFAISLCKGGKNDVQASHLQSLSIIAARPLPSYLLSGSRSLGASGVLLRHVPCPMPR